MPNPPTTMILIELLNKDGTIRSAHITYASEVGAYLQLGRVRYTTLSK